MFPFSMLNSWGSSSSEYSRRILPIFVSLGSSPAFGLAPYGSTSSFIVLNLYIVKGFAFFPALCWEKMAGPLSLSFAAAYIAINSGNNTTIAVKDAVKSNNRLKKVYINVVYLQL